MGVDFGGRLWLISLGFAWGVCRGLLKVEAPVGFFVELEGHRERWRGFGGVERVWWGSYPGL